MPRFSQRIGAQPVRVDVQKDSIDTPLRNKLWSALHVCLFEHSRDVLRSEGIDASGVSLRLWIHHFNEPADTLPDWGGKLFATMMRHRFFQMQWYEVYDFVEACLEQIPEKNRVTLTKLLNSFLESEMSAYRVVDGRIAEIVNESDIAAIESAITGTSALLGAQTHLRRALELLTDRAAPDPRNSIKESILAVEAVCQAIAEDTSASLGQAVKRLTDAGVKLHPALVGAWSKLYGYTSNADGIRHALSDEANLTFADGKYMLVSCSAFVSYLISLASDAGVALKPPR